MAEAQAQQGGIDPVAAQSVI